MISASAILPAQERFDRLLAERERLYPGNNQALREAFAFASKEYGDTMHWTGERVIDHCLGIMEILLRFQPDDHLLMACLLHHVTDSKRYTMEDMEKRYGLDIYELIRGENLLSHATLKNRRMSLDHLRLMFLKVSNGPRLVLLLLCQQAYTLEHLVDLPSDVRTQLCRDTLHIYAPVAARLGVYWLKNQMEARAFPVIYPTDALQIATQLEEMHRKHGYFLELASTALRASLRTLGLDADVEVREKQPYSIFRKMQMKSLTSIEQVYDLFALRVIVADEAACYQTLGILHRLGHPVVGRFKDYIAFPKPNGYKSLHTTLAQLPGVPEGVLIEAQIRTADMQRESEYGIAAHWSYKESGSGVLSVQRVKDVQQALTQTLAEEVPASSSITDQIFVLTPHGDVIQLPEGATPLDFAFHVHTTLGLSFKAAKVNGSIVPLSYVLENGDIVEVLKYKDPKPSPRWITLLKTASARSRLKRYLQQHQRPEYLVHGRSALNAELQKHRLPVLDTDLSVLRFFDGKELTFSEREDVLVAIGQGAQNAASQLQHLDLLQAHLQETPQQVRPTKESTPGAAARVVSNIRMPILYAKCCKPDEKHPAQIAGVIGRTGDVRVHAASCSMLKHVNPERRIAVRWED